MAKIVLDPVTNGATLSTLNANFDKIEAEFQNRVAYRDNVSLETNTIKNDMDHDGNSIFNVDTIEIQDLVVQGVNVPGSDLAGLPGLYQDVSELQTGLGQTNVNLANLTNTVNVNAAVEIQHHNASLRTSGAPISPISEIVDRAGKFLAFDPSGNPISSTGTGADLGLRSDLAANNGAGLVGWIRSPITSAINDVALWINAQPVHLYELAGLVVDKPDPFDPTTWDWLPALQAVNALPAANAVQINLPAHNINVSDTAQFTRGVLVHGQGMYMSEITCTDSTKYAIDFFTPTTRFEYFELKGVTVNGKYHVMQRWGIADDITNVANPSRSLRILDNRFISTYDSTTDPLAGTTTVATSSELEALGVALRLVMSYGAIVEGNLFENCGIAIANYGCTLSSFRLNRFRNNARHIHDERVTWYGSSFGMGADNEYIQNDILDGRRFGAVTFSGSYGSKFHSNYIEHLDRGGALSSATVVDFINPSHLRFHDNHINAFLAYDNSEPLIKFRSPAAKVDATNNIISDNYLTPFDNVHLVTVDISAEFHQRYPQVLVYKNNQNWPQIYQANVMTDDPTEDTFSAINLHHKSRPGGAGSLASDLWEYDATNRQYFIKHTTDLLQFNLGCNNPEKSTKIALVFDVDDIPASGGNGRQFITVTDEDGSILVNAQVIIGVISPQKFTVVVTTALPYTHKRLQVGLAGTHLLKIVSVKMEPLREVERRVTYNPGSIAAGASTTTTVSVPGAVVGDAVVASFNQVLSGLYMVATVEATDSVTVRTINPTAGAVDPPSGLLSVRVLKRDYH